MLGSPTCTASLGEAWRQARQSSRTNTENETASKPPLLRAFGAHSVLRSLLGPPGGIVNDSHYPFYLLREPPSSRVRPGGAPPPPDEKSERVAAKRSWRVPSPSTDVPPSCTREVILANAGVIQFEAPGPPACTTNKTPARERERQAPEQAGPEGKCPAPFGWGRGGYTAGAMNGSGEFGILDKQIDVLRTGGILPEKDIISLCTKVGKLGSLSRGTGFGSYISDSRDGGDGGVVCA